MKLDKFVSKTVAAYLRTYRPLEGWEQLALIYHSRRPLKQKRRAYEKLLDEFRGDRETVKHLRRHIKKANYWIDAPNREAKPGRVFVARADIMTRYTDGRLGERYLELTWYFSTYKKAKRWLNAERHEAIGHDGTTVRDCPLVSYQYIEEVGLDTNRTIAGYSIELDGSVVWAYDKDMCSTAFPNFPEHRFVNLGNIFLPGDIVLWHDCHRQFDAGWTYGVIPFYVTARTDISPNADYTDNTECVMFYDDENQCVFHDHPPTCNLDRYNGELPMGQEILRDLSLHIKGEKPLSDRDIKKIDPDGFFHWHPCC
jgi:hypothetical protein